MAVRKMHHKRSKARTKASKKSLAALEHKGLKRHRRKTSRVKKRKSYRHKKR